MAVSATQRGGEPLLNESRSEFEPRFGRDFSQVRVHVGEDAADAARGVEAQAYTIGQDIVFGDHEYEPTTEPGKRLLAHELTHVVQQGESHVPALQREPISPSASAEPDLLFDLIEEPAAETLLEFARGKPLTTAEKELLGAQLKQALGKQVTPEEMWRVLLSRRAQPLSIPARVVNQGPARLAELDAQLEDLARRKTDIQARYKRARGGPRAAAEKELEAVEERIKSVRTERSRLARGVALGSVGKGAPVGTGQITYAGIQVVDKDGTRVALEFAETTADEHAEEVIVGRLRQKLTPEQLKGAKLTVVGDQFVCPRCQAALTSFGAEFDVESIDATHYVRPRIGAPGTASPRTTLRTATKASSGGLPMEPVNEPIYTRPGGGGGGGGAAAPHVDVASPLSSDRASLKAGRVTVDYDVHSSAPDRGIKLSNIDLSEYPPDKEGPITGFFKDRPVLGQLAAAGASVAAGYVSNKLLDMVHEHFISVVDAAKKQFNTTYPTAFTLSREARIEEYLKAFVEADDKLERPKKRLMAAKIWTALLTPPAQVDAALRQVEENAAGFGVTKEDIIAYFETGTTYQDAMIDLYGKASAAIPFLPAISEDIHKRATWLSKIAGDVQDAFWSLVQSPIAYLPFGDIAVMEMWSIRDTFDNIAGEMSGFAATIDERLRDYNRLTETLDTALIKVGGQLDEWQAWRRAFVEGKLRGGAAGGPRP